MALEISILKMSLAVRIIPTLLHRGSSLVKGKQFSGDRVVGHALQAARIHASRGVDELCLLNIGATPAGQGPDFNMVRELCKDSFTPIAVGGGIRTLEDVALLFEAGADKVVVRDALEVVDKIAARYGCQALISSIDYSTENRGQLMRDKVESAAEHHARWGAGEILLTDMDREGMMQGYDLEMIERVSKAVSIPVIAHGGCGKPEHMLQAIQAGASAVAAGSMFLFEDITPSDCAKYLAEHGVEVRVPA